MPEGPELRLMVDFLNQHKNQKILYTKKSEVTKIKTQDLTEPHIFRVAESRGKELILTFDNSNNGKIIRYSFSMGMSGNWLLSETEPKHSHFKMFFNNGKIICMVDPRRFAKWKIVETWNKDRSPDLVFEPQEWWIHFNKKISNHKYDKIPIYELLMDQTLFNGVGNYIRAEVLYNMDIDPKLTHWEIDTATLHRAIVTVMNEAYLVGGMEMAAFKNPNQIEQPKNKGDWQKCYNKSTMSCIVDKNGRNFWYNPKYKL